MSDSTPWNVETALTHLTMLIEEKDRRYEQRFAAQESATASAMASAERAVLKAELAAEKRFESVNEFRNTLEDQQRNLIPRSEVDVIVRGISDKISALEKTQDAAIAERSGLKGGYGYAVGVVGFVLTILAVIAAIITVAGRVP